MYGVLTILFSGISAFFVILIFGETRAAMAVDQPHKWQGLAAITWGHGVNSRQKLSQVLSNDSIQMIEADVQLGKLAAGNASTLIPIMAHPPDTVSDLSLEEFLRVASEKLSMYKGLKLDFKSTEAFQASLGLLSKLFNYRTHEFPVWLNADILPGPGARKAKTVDPDIFLSNSSKLFPQTMLSVGWATKYGNGENSYKTEDFDAMVNLLAKHYIVQPVTFAIRAAFATQSHKEIVSLIKSSSDIVTLTLWDSSAEDVIDTDKLNSLVEDVGQNRTYLDLYTGKKGGKLPSSSDICKSSLLVITALLVLVSSQMGY